MQSAGSKLTPSGASTSEIEIAPSGAASTLFWMLPGPAAFLDHVTTLLNRSRAVAVHLSERTVLGHQSLIERALSRASFNGHDGSRPVQLRVHEASQIDCDIAEHLCGIAAKRQIGPAALAEWHTRREHIEGNQAAPYTVVLRPTGEVAQQAAWAYLCDFAAALPGSSGNTRVILLRVDNEPGWTQASLKAPTETGHFESASFNGALGPDEMASYLGMRMAMSGLGGTPSDAFTFPMKRLARSLIAEFAGFDAHFAEGLMRMTDAEVMSLPDSLGALAGRLRVSDVVWRQTSQALGTFTTIEGRDAVHTLHEWHLATNSGPHKATAGKELDRKKWRAYLVALMPWFEEVRHAIIGELRGLLTAHLAPTNGVKVRVFANSGKEVRIEIGNLECNDINAMTREEPPLLGSNRRESLVLELCSRVSWVRNEIAHLRAPKLSDVQKLIESLNVLNGSR